MDDLNLTVRQGEVFGLLGPNGAGKTTTTLMLLGLTEPTAGSASISGVDCTRNPIQVKRFVGYLPDNMGFYPDMTGRQNLRMTGAMNGLSGDYLEARIDELVARVGSRGRGPPGGHLFKGHEAAPGYRGHPHQGSRCAHHGRAHQQHRSGRHA